MRLSINTGFITNSSSVVYHFPEELLEDPEVKAVLDAYGVSGGFISGNLYNRETCDTFAVTEEQKTIVANDLKSDLGPGPAIDITGATIVVVHGDEYTGLASMLASLLYKTLYRLDGHTERLEHVEYN